MTPDPALLPLLTLLEKRRALIADHAWRDRAPDEHLDGLRQVSEAITAWLPAHPAAAIPPRLRHYLTQCSYDKAAAWIRDGGES